MNARGRFLSGLVTVVTALAGFAAVGALPAAAAPSVVHYVALGDSYAAGTAVRDDCPADGYPVLLESIRIELTANLACSGATTDEVIRDQVPALSSDTRLVTLTVGAANLGLSAVLAACLAEPPAPVECATAISNAQSLVRGCPADEGTLRGDLIGLYGEVAEKAPGARIVVTGYPLLFEPPADDDLDRAKTAINKATTDLNCVIERAVAEAKDADVNIRYVDVTEEFAEHGIVTVPGCTEPGDFIHNLLICDSAMPPRQDLEAFHPTAEGYRAYADAVSAALPNGWVKQEQLA
jgi:lysophospholipase L1-like esterase